MQNKGKLSQQNKILEDNKLIQKHIMIERPNPSKLLICNSIFTHTRPVD